MNYYFLLLISFFGRNEVLRTISLIQKENLPLKVELAVILITINKPI